MRIQHRAHECVARTLRAADEDRSVVVCACFSAASLRLLLGISHLNRLRGLLHLIRQSPCGDAEHFVKAGGAWSSGGSALPKCGDWIGVVAI
jgi:hypothetical protein